MPRTISPSLLSSTNERYPRLIITRRSPEDGELNAVPYPDVGAANEIKRLLDPVFFS